MITFKYNMRLVYLALMALVLIAAWYIFRGGVENPAVNGHSQRASGRRQTTHSQLIKERIDLLARMKETDQNYDLKVPIEFYGRVLDQHDEPVSGARIEMSWNSVNGITQRDLDTGTDGTFSLTGVSGKYLTVNVSGRDGYTGVQSSGYADYNDAIPGEIDFHVPNPASPVVFRLWKYSQPDPLQRWSIHSSVSTEGTVGWFDLKPDKAGKDGLGVSVMDHLPGNKKESHVTFKLICGQNCGLIETRDDPMFCAPATGYQSEIVHELRWREGEPSQEDPGSFRFYFRCDEGKYAAGNATLRFATDAKCEVSLYIYQNPSGSRNLEYDPRLEIKDNR